MYEDSETSQLYKVAQRVRGSETESRESSSNLQYTFVSNQSSILACNFLEEKEQSISKEE